METTKTIADVPEIESTDLFACPFCGEKPEVVYCEEECCGAMPRIVVCNCGAELHGEGQDLFRRWNFRANAQGDSHNLSGVIRVKDVLPPDGETIILIWASAGQISTGDYFNGKFRDASDCYSEVKTDPTHWMPWPDNWPVN